MGKFGGASLRSELGKAGSFALLAFAASHGSQWVSSRFEHAPALVVEIAVSLIVAFIGFVAYNAVFARPRLVATWSPSKQDDECDSNPLVQPANRGCIYVVRLNLIATSHIGALALLTVTRMGLLASIRLDHTEYVKLVREGNSRRGNGKGVRALRAGPRGDGLKCEWTRTPECWALHSTFLVALDPGGANTGNTSVNYELRVDRDHRGRLYRLATRILNLLVARDTTITQIRTQSFTNALQ